MTEAERFALITFLATTPEAGDVMPGTGGFRKVRFARAGKGKSGGYRLITFYSGPMLPVFLFTVYGKETTANLTKAERNELAKLSKILVAEYARKVHTLKG